MHPSPRTRCAAPGSTPAVARRPRAGHAACPADAASGGHLRRLGRGQVDAAVHDRPRHRRRRHRLALVGERGREVREFLEDDLGPEGLARSVVVVATSDEPAAGAPPRRVRRHPDRRVVPRPGPRRPAPDGLADPVRDGPARGRALGRRAAGHPRLPADRVRAAAAAARAGRHRRIVGSITGLYTVLVEGDDHNEPIADAARSILDGHVVLSRAARHRRPLPGDRRARVDLPRRPRGHDAGAARRRHASCAGCWPPTRDAQGPDRDRRLRVGHVPARRLARSHSEKQWTASSGKTCMTLARHRTRGPRSISSSGEAALEALSVPTRTSTPRPTSARGHRRAELMHAHREARFAAERVNARVAEYVDAHATER